MNNNVLGCSDQENGFYHHLSRGYVNTAHVFSHLQSVVLMRSQAPEKVCAYCVNLVSQG